MKNITTDSSWIEKDICISDVQAILESDQYDVDVLSPDGFVPVIDFVDKGIWDEYVLTTIQGVVVRCNENHLFETKTGWQFAKDLQEKTFEVLTSNGWSLARLVKTGNIIPIVDITVNHTNHRYYTNGISSHNTGGGKSLFLCHLAASYLMQKLNVLYITLEMSETKIAERIDANLLNMPVKDLKSMDQAVFINRVRNIQQQQSGKLIIKEYPTGSANVTHFRHLLQELNLKKNFVPDVILIDYLGIAASSRFKLNNAVGMYTYIKAVAEEVRGLAQEFKVPIWSAAQLNREGFKNSDPGMENTSESFGLPFTADLMIALISTEELDAMNQITVKQLKNRYNDPSYYKRFNLGIDRSRMKLYNLTDTSTTKSKSSNEDIIVPSRGRKDYNFSNIEIYEDMLHIDEELF